MEQTVHRQHLVLIIIPTLSSFSCDPAMWELVLQFANSRGISVISLDHKGLGFRQWPLVDVDEPVDMDEFKMDPVLHTILAHSLAIMVLHRYTSYLRRVGQQGDDDEKKEDQPVVDFTDDELEGLCEVLHEGVVVGPEDARAFLCLDHGCHFFFHILRMFFTNSPDPNEFRNQHCFNELTNFFAGHPQWVVFRRQIKYRDRDGLWDPLVLGSTCWLHTVPQLIAMIEGHTLRGHDLSPENRWRTDAIANAMHFPYCPFFYATLQEDDRPPLGQFVRPPLRPRIVRPAAPRIAILPQPPPQLLLLPVASALAMGVMGPPLPRPPRSLFHMDPYPPLPHFVDHDDNYDSEDEDVVAIIPQSSISRQSRTLTPPPTSRLGRLRQSLNPEPEEVHTTHT
jgi:hypothetical protein